MSEFQKTEFVIPEECRKYRITLQERCLGTAPLDPQIYEKYIASKAPRPELIEEEVDMIINDGNKEITGFRKDSEGLYLPSFMILGFMKEAGNVLKEILGIKNLKSKITTSIFVFPQYIHLKDNFDGYFDRTIRVQTPKGPRTSIVRSEYVDEGTAFEMEVRCIKHKELSISLVEKVLCYGERIGIGQWRSSGLGRFTWEPISDIWWTTDKRAS
jgi:hypothetical protein